MLRERVTADQQAEEIRQTWFSTSDHPTESSQIRPRPARAAFVIRRLKSPR
jgi:hypothetical protein